MLTVGTVAAGGFATLRTRPWAVAIWAIVYIAAAVAVGMMVRPMIAPMIMVNGPNPDPQALSQMMTMMSRMFLLEFVYLILILILLTAAMRAVIRPEAPGFAYIRLGGDELRIVGLSIFLVVAFYIAMIVGVIVVGVIVVAVTGAAGPAAAAPAAILEALVLIGVFVYAEVRLSLALPLTLLRGQFVLAESWRLTRGRFWTLLGAYLLLFLIIFLLWLVVAAITFGPYFANLIAHRGDPEALRAMAHAQMTRPFSMMPMALVAAGLSGVLGALSLAFFGGASATAARILAEPIDPPRDAAAASA
ncbi:MAG: hypothetical protein QOK17_972 [Sphingomonadales bacterium]|jgi:hypothetical protein|nr:hypothetical protein [Sphingomonadales bacterium]